MKPAWPSLIGSGTMLLVIAADTLLNWKGDQKPEMHPLVAAGVASFVTLLANL